jgi:MFS family permease
VSRDHTPDDPGRTSADDRLAPRFRRFWAASGCFFLSEGIRLAAFPLLAAAFTKNPFDVSLVTGVQDLAWLLFGLQAGAVVDRVAPGWLMLLAGAARAIILGALVIAVLLGVHSVAVLVAAAFLIGSSSTLGDVASLSMLPGLVPVAALERANSRLVVASVTFYEFFGPLAGSALFALARWLPIGADLIMQLAGIACVLSFVNTMRSRAPRDSRVRVNMRSEIASGIRWLAGERFLLVITASGCLLSLADSAWWAILVLYSERILRLAKFEYGFLLAAGALGGLCGAAAAERLATRYSTSAMLIGTGLLTAAGPLLLAIFRNPLLSGVLMAVVSGAIACWNVIAVSVRQRQVPAELLGRVNALQRLGLLGGAGIGALLGGWLATAVTLTAPFVMAGVVGLLATGLMVFSHARGGGRTSVRAPSRSLRG